MVKKRKRKLADLYEELAAARSERESALEEGRKYQEHINFFLEEVKKREKDLLELLPEKREYILKTIKYENIIARLKENCPECYKKHARDTNT